MRGFDTSGSIFVDGIRDLGSISRDVFNIEQIEVAKGPAGTDNGSTAPSGAITLATNSAFQPDYNAEPPTRGTEQPKKVRDGKRGDVGVDYRCLRYTKQK